MSAGPVNTLEITVQRKSGASWPIVADYSRVGVLLPTRSEGVLDLGEELIQQLTALLGQPRDYGIRLGQVLFKENVRDAFVGALRESEDQLRVLLCIEADDLRSLRWERLGAPIDGSWGVLTQDQRTPFSLYIPSTTDRRFPPIGRRDLRALLLVASPQDSDRYKLAPFGVDATVASVKAALGTIPCDVLANLAGAIGSPGLDELCARLSDRSRQYTLLHVVCHGKVIEGGETVVYWANSDNQVQPVTATELLNRLSTVRGPRGLPHFAFLSTCESAGAGADGALEGLAQRLVRDLGIPAILAMTDKVTMQTAAALAKHFYRQLGQSGEVDTALPEATAALAKRGDILVPALFSRLGGRPLFSNQLDRELTNAEIKFGLGLLKDAFVERAPVLQKECERQAAIVTKTLGDDATALSRDARTERQQALAEINTLCLDATDLSFNALALDQPLPQYDARCPFRGLYPFGPKDREFFFGREALIEQLCQKLADQNFLPVLGPSGSGKSSVVLAGLIPALQGQEKGLQLADFTPGSEPLAHLEAALTTLSDQPGVLVVDQFEEVFTLCSDEVKRLAFIERMLSDSRSRRVVLTMRADFWGDCAPYKDLREQMEARQSLIAPMDAAELRKAMEMQAAAVGLRFEAGLSSRILDEVQGEPGAMPLLQHALLELWKRRHGRWLRAAEYEAIGGVQQAIAKTADDVYDSLSFDEQQQIRNIFVRLTRLDTSLVQGERRRDTRRRVWLEELVPAGGDLAITRRLVQQLAGAEARLVVTGVDETTQRETVEVAHEALIRHWPRLQRWLDEDRANFLLRDAIAEAADDWEQHGEEESYLIHTGARLTAVEALSERSAFFNRNEQDYIKACVDRRTRQEKEKEEQRQRELIAAQRLASEQRKRARVAIGLSFLALLLAAGAGWQWLKANDEQARAERSAKHAIDITQGFVRDAVQLSDSFGVPRSAIEVLLNRADAAFSQLMQEGTTSQLRSALAWQLMASADTYGIIGKSKQQRDRAERARDILQALADDHPSNPEWRRQLAISHDLVGEILANQMRLDAALAEYRAAQSIREKLSKDAPSDPKLRRDLSISQQQLGGILLRQGHLDEALTAFKKALDISEPLARDYPTNLDKQRDVLVIDHYIGDVLAKQGDLNGAGVVYETSLSIAKQLAADEPANVQRPLDVLTSYRKIGTLREDQGDIDAALAAYQNSLSIAKQLAADDPAEVPIQRDLSLDYENVGRILLKQRQVNAALDAYRTSLAIAERLAAADPTDASLQQDLSIRLNESGDALKVQGDLQAALDHDRRSLEIRKQLAAGNPTNTELQRGVLEGYDRIGELLDKRGQVQEAIVAYQASNVIAERLAAAEPTNADWQYLSRRQLGRVRELERNKEGARDMYCQAKKVVMTNSELHPTESRWQGRLHWLEQHLNDIRGSGACLF